MPDLYLPPAAVPPDPEFRETEAGGHALVLEYAAGHALVVGYGDCEFYFRCQCGQDLAPRPLRPDKPWRPVIERAEAHSGAHLASPALFTAHCQCGVLLGQVRRVGHPLYSVLEDRVSRNWERHSMTEVHP